MADNFTQMRVGEKSPVYGYVTMSNGTCTIQGSPAPVCTLVDSTGAVVSGFNGLAVTGYDATALQTARMWFLLDTTGLSVGYFTLNFKVSVLGSDGMTRIKEPSMQIQVVALNA